jgi:hypothetical protein
MSAIDARVAGATRPLVLYYSSRLRSALVAEEEGFDLATGQRTHPTA